MMLVDTERVDTEVVRTKYSNHRENTFTAQSNLLSQYSTVCAAHITLFPNYRGGPVTLCVIKNRQCVSIRNCNQTDWLIHGRNNRFAPSLSVFYRYRRSLLYLRFLWCERMRPLSYRTFGSPVSNEPCRKTLPSTKGVAGHRGYYEAILM